MYDFIKLKEFTKEEKIKLAEGELTDKDILCDHIWYSLFWLFRDFHETEGCFAEIAFKRCLKLYDIEEAYATSIYNKIMKYMRNKGLNI